MLDGLAICHIERFESLQSRNDVNRHRSGYITGRFATWNVYFGSMAVFVVRFALAGAKHLANCRPSSAHRTLTLPRAEKPEYRHNNSIMTGLIGM